VVGADGARSAVRRSIGATFEGHTWPERFVATNVWLDLEEHGFGKTTLVHHPADWAVTVKINKEGLWRVTFGEDASLPEDEVLRRIPERYGRILPASAQRATYEIESAAPYRVHQRCADRLRIGRVLLAGDAAHITNPVGGMGLNTGALVSDQGPPYAADCSQDLSAHAHRGIANVFDGRKSPGQRARVGRTETRRARDSAGVAQSVSGILPLEE